MFLKIAAPAFEYPHQHPSEAAVREVLDDPIYCSKAKILAAEYARYDTAKEIIDIAESCRRRFSGQK